jgi:hypothetical protein
MKAMTWTLGMAALLAPAIAGCGPGGADVAGLPAELERPGVYTVPTAPGASFPIAKVRVEQESGTISVYYDLPADLVGRPQRVELTGAPDASGTIELSGEAGTSTCTVSATAFSCREHLSGIHDDAAAASAGLPPGAPQAAAVWAFSSDPIGVLGVPLSPAAGAAMPPEAD